MVSMAVHGAATDGLAAINNDTVRRYSGFHTQSGQAICHHLDPVAFLDPKLFCAPQYRSTVGACSGNEQYREFIDGQGHLILRNVDTLELRGADPKVSHRLATDFALVQNLNAGAHLVQDVDHPNSGRVHPHMPKDQIGSRSDTRSYQKKCG